ncbi:MAG: acylphosphatase [Pseudomonadota bacterium]
MNEKTMHVYVQGRVQGVGFRAATLRKAKALGLTGWVKNLTDGRVEVLASGELASLQQLEKWLNHGPRFASEIIVDVDWLEYESFKEFEIN